MMISNAHPEYLLQDQQPSIPCQEESKTKQQHKSYPAKYEVENKRTQETLNSASRHERSKSVVSSSERQKTRKASWMIFSMLEQKTTQDLKNLMEATSRVSTLRRFQAARGSFLNLVGQGAYIFDDDQSHQVSLDLAQLDTAAEQTNPAPGGPQAQPGPQNHLVCGFRPTQAHGLIQSFGNSSSCSSDEEEEDDSECTEKGDTQSRKIPVQRDDHQRVPGGIPANLVESFGSSSSGSSETTATTAE